LNGTVREFDAHAGLGVIESVDGTRHAFHCTQLADGSREVKVGVIVRYDVVPGGLGAWEAGRIEPVKRK
jgi:cold shock CspA family protein